MTDKDTPNTGSIPPISEYEDRFQTDSQPVDFKEFQVAVAPNIWSYSFFCVYLSK